MDLNLANAPRANFQFTLNQYSQGLGWQTAGRPKSPEGAAVTILAKVRPELRDELEDAAYALGVTASVFIGEAVREKLERAKKANGGEPYPASPARLRKRG